MLISNIDKIYSKVNNKVVFFQFWEKIWDWVFMKLYYDTYFGDIEK